MVPSAKWRGRGRNAGSTTDEDEALARKLQAQWLSEDSTAGVGEMGGFRGEGGGQGGGFQVTYLGIMAYFAQFFHEICLEGTPQAEMCDHVPLFFAHDD